MFDFDAQFTGIPGSTPSILLFCNQLTSGRVEYSGKVKPTFTEGEGGKRKVISEEGDVSFHLFLGEYGPILKFSVCIQKRRMEKDVPGIYHDVVVKARKAIGKDLVGTLYFEDGEVALEMTGKEITPGGALRIFLKAYPDKDDIRSRAQPRKAKEKEKGVNYKTPTPAPVAAPADTGESPEVSVDDVPF